MPVHSSFDNYIVLTCMRENVDIYQCPVKRHSFNNQQFDNQYNILNIIKYISDEHITDIIRIINSEEDCQFIIKESRYDEEEGCSFFYKIKVNIDVDFNDKINSYLEDLDTRKQFKDISSKIRLLKSETSFTEYMSDTEIREQAIKNLQMLNQMHKQLEEYNWDILNLFVKKLE